MREMNNQLGGETATMSHAQGRREEGREGKTLTRRDIISDLLF